MLYQHSDQITTMDDENSIQQRSGTGSLDTFYPREPIRNEMQTSHGTSRVVIYPLEYTPVRRGTLTGCIYRPYQGVLREQQFVVDINDIACLQRVSEDSIHAIDGCLNLNTGELTLVWNVSPGSHYLIVNYQYAFEGEVDDRYGRHSMSCRTEMKLPWKEFGF